MNAADCAATMNLTFQGLAVCFIRLRMAQRVRERLTSLSKQEVWIVTGIRDPLCFAVANFFQNIDTHCPWLTYNTNAVEDEANRVLIYFSERFHDLLHDRRASNYKDNIA